MNWKPWFNTFKPIFSTKTLLKNAKKRVGVKSISLMFKNIVLGEMSMGNSFAQSRFGIACTKHYTKGTLQNNSTNIRINIKYMLKEISLNNNCITWPLMHRNSSSSFTLVVVTNLTHKLKTQYLQIYNILDTSIQRPISGQSTNVVKCYIYMCFMKLGLLLFKTIDGPPISSGICQRKRNEIWSADTVFLLCVEELLHHVLTSHTCGFWLWFYPYRAIHKSPTKFNSRLCYQKLNSL